MTSPLPLLLLLQADPCVELSIADSGELQVRRSVGGFTPCQIHYPS